jgi:hypothetical protein
VQTNTLVQTMQTPIRDARSRSKGHGEGWGILQITACQPPYQSRQFFNNPPPSDPSGRPLHRFSKDRSSPPPTRAAAPSICRPRFAPPPPSIETIGEGGRRCAVYGAGPRSRSWRRALSDHDRHSPRRRQGPQSPTHSRRTTTLRAARAHRHVPSSSPGAAGRSVAPSFLLC